MYTELSELSKKAINYATKANMQHKLLNVFKVFIYDVQCILDPENSAGINNPAIIRYKR